MNTIAQNTISIQSNQEAGQLSVAERFNQSSGDPALADNQRISSDAAPTKAEIAEALDVVNQAAIFESRSLSFAMDELSGKSIVKVIDVNSEQLIRQIPSEELVKVARDIKRLQEEMGQSLGLLVNNKV